MHESKDFATDMYLLERKRRWEMEQDEMVREDWRNLCRGIRSVLLIYAVPVAVGLYFWLR